MLFHSFPLCPRASLGAVTGPAYPGPVTPLYGLDIETDTLRGGLDPRVCPIVAVALATDSGVHVAAGPETRLLREIDGLLRSLDPGIIVTWNGSGFDLPFLVERARRRRVSLGLRLREEPGVTRTHPPLPGHASCYRASWHGHDHLDAYLAYRSLARGDEGSLALKAVAARAGFEVLEVDRSRIHELDPGLLARYVASDARLAVELARTRWGELLGFRDLLIPLLAAG